MNSMIGKIQSTNIRRIWINGMGILFIFFLLYLFSFKEKKNLEEILDNNVKVFQKAFDTSEDAILILSYKNEVIYANNTMVRLLQLKHDFLMKTWKTIAQIKVKKDWIVLDKFIEQNRIDF